MRSVEFAYWLQGFFELSESNNLTEKQTQMIKNHLKLVFIHEIDPSYSDDPKVLEKLQAVHDGNDSQISNHPFNGRKGNSTVKC